MASLKSQLVFVVAILLIGFAVTGYAGPPCANFCNCTTKPSCTNGGPKSNCCWTAGTPGNPAHCANTLIDPANCGTCGTACNPTEVCFGGVCQCPNMGDFYCSKLGRCANNGDFQTNIDNCGACDSPCSSDRVCDGGSCECPPDSAYCPILKRCAANSDPAFISDPSNCGACNRVCWTGEPGQQCIGGSCVCPTAYQFCTNLNKCPTRTDFQTDANNCGECDKKCRDDQVCTDGLCVCQGTLRECSGTCVDFTSKSNCNGCGQVCRRDQICTASGCGCSADAPFCETAGLCGTADVFNNNDDNCGGCGNSCGYLECGDGQCIQGTCGFPGEKCCFFTTCRVGTCQNGRCYN